jgi:hypothetical protein
VVANECESEEYGKENEERQEFPVSSSVGSAIG